MDSCSTDNLQVSIKHHIKEVKQEIFGGGGTTTVICNFKSPSQYWIEH